MDILNIIMSILQFTVPSLVVFGVCYFMLKLFFDNEDRKRYIDVRMKNQSVISPLRLQAYERITLLLERISPNQLILRSSRPGVTAQMLKQELLQEVHSEFNHNLSQQIYISSQAWSLVRVVKEEVIGLINNAYNALPPEATGIDLSKTIIEILMKSDSVPTQKALDFIRKEVELYFES